MAHAELVPHHSLYMQSEFFQSKNVFRFQTPSLPCVFSPLGQRIYLALRVYFLEFLNYIIIVFLTPPFVIAIVLLTLEIFQANFRHVTPQALPLSRQSKAKKKKKKDKKGLNQPKPTTTPKKKKTTTASNPSKKTPLSVSKTTHPSYKRRWENVITLSLPPPSLSLSLISSPLLSFSLR